MQGSVSTLSATCPANLVQDAAPIAPLQDRARDIRSRRAGVQKGQQLLPPPRQESKGKQEAADPNRPATWEPRWRAAYEKYANHGTILKDQLAELLRAAGHRNTFNELVTQVADKIVPYTALSTASIFQFLTIYEQRIKDDLQKAFVKRAGGDSLMPFNRLEELVFELGYTPLPNTISELLFEACDALKVALEGQDLKDHGTLNGCVTLPVFEKFVEILVEQEGFSAQELRALQLAFQRFDLDGSGDIEVSEIGAILVWLGYWSESDVIKDLMNQEMKHLDTIDVDAFVLLMRRHRGFEYAHSIDLFERFDVDGNNILGPGEVMLLFRKLGLSLRPETLFEVVEDCELSYNVFDFNDFWKILELIRHREGFCSDELRDISTTFEHFDRFRSGELITRSVPNALRWLGYIVGRGKTERVDWRHEHGNRGRICQIEFVKIVRDHAEGDLRSARKVFCELAANKGAGLLPVKVLELALHKLCSYYRPHYRSWMEENMPGQVDNATASLDFEEFRRVFRGCRDRVRDKIRKHRGFTDEEISRFKKHIAQQGIKMGEPGTEEVKLPPAALIELFRTLCPAVGTSPEVHGMLKKALSYHQVGRGMDWVTFLKVMRTYTDLQEEEQACGMHLVRDELGISESSKVEEYLDIFQQYFDKGPKSLSPKDLNMMYCSGRQEAEVNEEGLEHLRERLCSLHDQQGAAGSVQKFVIFTQDLRSIDSAVLSGELPESQENSNSPNGTVTSPNLPSKTSSTRSLRGKPNRLLPEVFDD